MMKRPTFHIPPTADVHDLVQQGLRIVLCTNYELVLEHGGNYDGVRDGLCDDMTLSQRGALNRLARHAIAAAQTALCDHNAGYVTDHEFGNWRGGLYDPTRLRDGGLGNNILYIEPYWRLWEPPPQGTGFSEWYEDELDDLGPDDAARLEASRLAGAVSDAVRAVIYNAGTTGREEQR